MESPLYIVIDMNKLSLYKFDVVEKILICINKNNIFY